MTDYLSHLTSHVFPGKTKERRLQNPNQMKFMPQGRQFLLLSIYVIYVKKKYKKSPKEAEQVQYLIWILQR